MLKFDTYARSDTGKVRTNNEDAFGATEPRDRQPLNQSGCIYAVADGMGGHQQGEHASAYSVDTLLKAYYRQPHVPPDKRLRQTFLDINQDLVNYTKEHLQPGERSGTTLVTAVVRGDKLWVASVGDSRLYLIRQGGIRQITRDHTLVAELVRAGGIKQEEAIDPNYRNRLSRSIGIESRLDVDVFPAIPLQRGDLLLLCTDGLTRYATSEDILAACHGTAKEIVERLIQFANDCGGSDNITVFAIRAEGRPQLRAGLSSNQVAWIVLGVVVFLALLLFAGIGWMWWRRNVAVPTPTAALTLTSLPPSTSPVATSADMGLTPAALLPGTPLTGTPAVTVSPTSSLIDCQFTVASGNTTAGIAERFGAQMDQIYRLDGTQQEMNVIRTGEVLVIKGISIPACTNGGGVIPLTLTPTP